MTTKITITVTEDYEDILSEKTETSVSMSTDDPDVRFFERAFRAALHAVQFHPDTVDELFSPTVENEVVFCHPSQLPDLLGPTDEADLCDCHCGQGDCPELRKGTLMGFSMYTHPDKDVETLHGDDIAGRAPRTPDPEAA